MLRGVGGCAYGAPVRVYLDVCCLNRPFDDQSQDRIQLEAEAILLLLRRIQSGALEWVSSEVVDHEIGLTPDAGRRARVTAVARGATHRFLLEDEDERRGAELSSLGIGAFDALHLAVAERAGVDVLLTTDERFMKRASRAGNRIRIIVDNPLYWLLENAKTWT